MLSGALCWVNVFCLGDAQDKCIVSRYSSDHDGNLTLDGYRRMYAQQLCSLPQFLGTVSGAGTVFVSVRGLEFLVKAWC